MRRGGKRDFSPYLNRGLGESHSTQYAVREYARKVCGPYLVDTKAGNEKVDSVLVAMCVKNEYID